ncbi:hypothetical protein CSUI_003860 [Cystoisospora suis]|uniref:Uncharacterized protein n=1 Tax=Cystoisospora suis TaxID=483139 RepID=A0A2C6L2Q5_9APIC|nr:hypothetical protein CSUI_003860 [Cystoisospora suis]
MKGTGRNTQKLISVNERGFSSFLLRYSSGMLLRRRKRRKRSLHTEVLFPSFSASLTPKSFFFFSSSSHSPFTCLPLSSTSFYQSSFRSSLGCPLSSSCETSSFLETTAPSFSGSSSIFYPSSSSRSFSSPSYSSLPFFLPSSLSSSSPFSSFPSVGLPSSSCSSSSSSPFSLSYQTRLFSGGSRQARRKKRGRRGKKEEPRRESRPSRRKQVEIERKVKNPFEYEKQRDGIELIKKGAIFSPEGCDSWKLAVLICALNKFGYAKDRDLLLRYAEQAYSLSASMYPRHASLVLNVLARHNLLHLELLETLGSHLSVKLRNTNSQDLSLIANAYAKLNFYHPRLFKRLSEEIPHKLTHFEPEHVVSVTHAFVKLKIPDTLFFDDIAEQVLRDLSSYSPRCTALIGNLLGSRLRYDHTDFWMAFLSHAWRKRQELCASEAIMIAHGLSAVFYTGEKRLKRGQMLDRMTRKREQREQEKEVNENEGEDDDHGEGKNRESHKERESIEMFLRFMIEKISKDFHDLSIPEIAQVFNTCSRTGIDDPDLLFRCLYTRFQQSPKLIDDVGVAFISQVLHACGVLSRVSLEDLNRKKEDPKDRKKTYKKELIDLLTTRLYLIALEDVFGGTKDERQSSSHRALSAAGNTSEEKRNELEDLHESDREEQNRQRKDEEKGERYRSDNGNKETLPYALTPQAISVCLRALQRLRWSERGGKSDEEEEAVYVSSRSSETQTQASLSSSQEKDLRSSSSSFHEDVSSSSSLLSIPNTDMISSPSSVSSSLLSASSTPSSSSPSAPPSSSIYSLLESPSSPSSPPPSSFREATENRLLSMAFPPHLTPGIDLQEVQEKLVPLLCTCLSKQLPHFTPQGLCESVDALSSLGVENDFLFYQISTEIRSKRIWPFLTPQSLITILRAFSRHCHSSSMKIQHEKRLGTGQQETSTSQARPSPVPLIVVKCLDRLRHSIARMDQEECIIFQRTFSQIEEMWIPQERELLSMVSEREEKNNDQGHEANEKKKKKSGLLLDWSREKIRGSSTHADRTSEEFCRGEEEEDEDDKREVFLEGVVEDEGKKKGVVSTEAKRSSGKDVMEVTRGQKGDGIDKTIKKNQKKYENIEEMRSLIRLVKRGLDRRLMNLGDLHAIHEKKIQEDDEDIGVGCRSKDRDCSSYLGGREKSRYWIRESTDGKGEREEREIDKERSALKRERIYSPGMSSQARRGVEKAMASAFAAEDAEREAVRFFSEREEPYGNYYRLRHVETRTKYVEGSEKDEEKEEFDAGDVFRQERSSRLTTGKASKSDDQKVLYETQQDGETPPSIGKRTIGRRRRGRCRARQMSFSFESASEPSFLSQSTDTTSLRRMIDEDPENSLSKREEVLTPGTSRDGNKKSYRKPRRSEMINDPYDVDPARYAKLIFEQETNQNTPEKDGQKRNRILGDSLDELFSRLHGRNQGGGSQEGAGRPEAERALECKETKEEGDLPDGHIPMRREEMLSSEAMPSQRRKKGR